MLKCFVTTAVDHMAMLTRHLEKQLEESRAEVEALRRRLELACDESHRAACDKAAMAHTLSRKVCPMLRLQLVFCYCMIFVDDTVFSFLTLLKLDFLILSDEPIDGVV